MTTKKEKKIVKNQLQELKQYSFKQGKKQIIEKNFRECLKILAKEGQTKFWDLLNISLTNLKPYITLSTKRIRGKNILSSAYITEKHSKYLQYSWLIKGIRRQPLKTLKKKIPLEIKEAAVKKGWSFEKKKEIHKIAYESNWRNSRK